MGTIDKNVLINNTSINWPKMHDELHHFMKAENKSDIITSYIFQRPPFFISTVIAGRHHSLT